MLEILRYIYFGLTIDKVNKLSDKFTNIRDIALGSLICSLASIIWYPALYISLLYHFIFVAKYFNERYQIDARKYSWALDYMESSSNQYFRIWHTFYRSYFDRFVDRINHVEERRELVTVGEYVKKLLQNLQLFIIPITAFKLYTDESFDTLYVFYWIIVLYRAAIAGKTNFVRLLHWFFFYMFAALDSKLIVYPYICSLCLVANNIFHFGLPDKIRELFGHKPTRYCKFCKDGLTNNLLEGVLIDHRVIERRTHRDCYCRYVYQCQVRYWFDTTVSLFSSLYMAYWLEGDAKIWLLIITTTLYSDIVICLLPKMWYSNYIIMGIQLIIIGGFTNPFCSYFMFLPILYYLMYKNVIRVV